MRWIGPSGFGFVVFLCFLGTNAAESKELVVQQHDLEVRLDPEHHELIGEDTIHVGLSQARSGPLEFQLNQNFVVEKVRIGLVPIGFKEKRIDPTAAHEDVPFQTLIISIPAALQNDDPVAVTIFYKGRIQDPPRPAKGLRFVRPDKTNGHIGKEGVYLTSETGWYPNSPDTLSTFAVRVTVPDGWKVVTQGKEMSRSSKSGEFTSEWQVVSKSEALTLVANRFVKDQEDWKGVEISTYLFPEDAHLSEQYLKATVKYLEFYTHLLGPYPFPKFSVVENFFPSGLGLPSFTLLGNRVIKRGYTQPYSLGHEIVHSWFGNSVLNEFSTGNWVEGLTTYLANYYYEEIHEPPQKVMANRRRMIYEYSLFVNSSNEYPLVQFHHKENRVDNAIGYQKAAMIFHMLRREIGDQAFFSGIRLLVQTGTGTYTEWSDLERAFEHTSGQDLRWFFQQWVERSGAPSMEILNASVRADPDHSGQFKVALHLRQRGMPFRLQFPVFFELEKGKTLWKTMTLAAHEQQIVSFIIEGNPLEVTLDPQYESLRKVARSGIPPMLNLWATDESRIVIAPVVDSPEVESSYQPILNRIQSLNSRDIHVSNEDLDLAGKSVLVLGNPDQNKTARDGIRHCGESLKWEKHKIVLQGRVYEGSDIALLVSCVNPGYPGQVLTIFLGQSSSAARVVARLLFFYGWDSYLVFQQGKVVERGMFPPPQNTLAVRFGDAA